jgi:hypothetical protein
MTKFLRDYLAGFRLSYPTHLYDAFGQVTKNAERVDRILAACFMGFVQCTLMEAALGGGGYCGFEAADIIIGSVTSARGGPAFLADDLFFPSYAEYRLFVYVALERRTEAREFLTSLALKYKKAADDVKITQTPRYLWTLSVTYSDLLFLCVVVISIWDLERAKKAGRVDEAEEVLTQLGKLFKENYGSEKEEYDLMVTFLKSNGNLSGDPPRFISGDDRDGGRKSSGYLPGVPRRLIRGDANIGPILCKRLMEMVKFGPTFVEFLEKTATSENR